MSADRRYNAKFYGGVARAAEYRLRDEYGDFGINAVQYMHFKLQPLVRAVCIVIDELRRTLQSRTFASFPRAVQWGGSPPLPRPRGEADRAAGPRRTTWPHGGRRRPGRRTVCTGGVRAG